LIKENTTMTQAQQPEALRLAAICETKGMFPVADELNRMHARILELEQGKCLHQIAEPAAHGLDAPNLYYLQDARHHAMVGNCPSFWREGGGYTTNLDEAERFTLEAAMKQHKCRETDLPWLCTEVDKLRRPTVDCQYMPRSWDTQRAALAAQAKQGGV
jgi:hypothetical protein